MKVKVTEQDIKRGVPRDPCRCMIALACRRAFPEATSVLVGGVQVTVRPAPEPGQVWANSMDYILPVSVITAINDFDNGLKVEPFEFELEPVC